MSEVQHGGAADGGGGDRLWSTALRAVLVAIAYACLGFYLFFLVLNGLPKWYWAYDDPPVNPWHKMRINTAVVYNHGEGVDLFDGWNSQSIIMGCIPILLAALAVYLAVWIGPTPFKPRNASKIKLWFKRVAHYQLPPRRFWIWWCGGMTVLESVLVLAWIGVHVVFVVEFMKYYLPDVNMQYEQMDSVDVAYSDPVWRSRFNTAVLAISWVMYFDLGLMFFPIPHSSIVQYLTGLTYSQLIRYHRWMGHSFMLFVSAHGVGYWVYWAITSRISFWATLVNWNTDGWVINLFSGTISYVFLLALWITSTEYVRRNFFEVFYRMHIIGFLGFFTFGFMHYYWIWPTCMPALMLYAADVVFRMWQASRPTRAVRAEVNSDAGVTSLELQVDKSFKVGALQEAFVCIPAISRWQYHPVTLGSVQDSKDGTRTIQLHYKVYGKWTKALQELVQSGTRPAVRLLGPYGAFPKLQGSYFRSSSWCSYDTLLLIGGGIGVVPLLSLLREVMGLQDAAAPGRKTPPQPRVHFMWAVRSLGELEVFDAEVLEAIQSCSKWLTVSLHYTGSTAAALAAAKLGNLPKHNVPSKADTPTIWDSHVSAFGIPEAPPSLPAGHPILGALLVLAAFAGGFFGLVFGHTYMSEQFYDGTYYSMYWAGGLVIWICWLIGAVGFPVVAVVIPMQVWDMWRHKRHAGATACIAGQKASKHGLKIDDALQQGSGGSSSSNENSSPSAKDKIFAPEPMHSVAVFGGPDGVLYLQVAEGGNEAASRLEVAIGRPDLAAAIHSARAACTGPMFGIYAAGPAAMQRRVELEVSRVNCLRDGLPYADYHKEAWEL